MVKFKPVPNKRKDNAGGSRVPKVLKERHEEMGAPALITTLFRLFPRQRRGTLLEHFPYIHCADGFSMSVQASAGHYCEPRNNIGPWTAFEVGYPSQEEPLLGDNGGDTVWGWVPATTIDAIIAKHGGIVRFGK